MSKLISTSIAATGFVIVAIACVWITIDAPAAAAQISGPILQIGEVA